MKTLQLEQNLKLITDKLISSFLSSELEPNDVVKINNVLSVGFIGLNTHRILYGLGPVASVVLNPGETYEALWDNTQRVFGIVAGDHNYSDEELDSYLTSYSVSEGNFYVQVEFNGNMNCVNYSMVDNLLNDLLYAVTVRDTEIVKKRLS